MFSLNKSKHYNLQTNLKVNEKKYFNFLENKNVAIVGIAPTENEDGLDSFDLVIRFNHINLKEKLDVRKKGQKQTLLISMVFTPTVYLIIIAI